jgi:hypothetical protein
VLPLQQSKPRVPLTTAFTGWHVHANSLRKRGSYSCAQFLGVNRYIISLSSLACSF